MYLDLIRAFSVGNRETIGLLPTSALDMIMNYAVIPEEYSKIVDKASDDTDPKTYVKGATGSPKIEGDATSKDQWAQFDVLVDGADGAQYGFGMAASALIAYTLY